MQILFADSRNEKCQTNRDGNKHRRGNIRIAKPTKFVQSFEDASATNTLYIMDEPTTGLHFDDINKLLAVLHKHVNAGNTLVVVEHNLDVIKSADWIIDLGPEGGAAGGQIVAEGRPEQVAKVVGSHTGRFLADALKPVFSSAGC